MCTECGWTTTKWAGRCGECQTWGTVVEKAERIGAARIAASLPYTPAQPITEISGEIAQKYPSGEDELDRVLGGGIVPGAVMLLAGDPGIGKSTLLLSVASKAAVAAQQNGAGPILYVTGEESAAQVRARAERIGAVHPQLLLAAENSVEKVLGHLEYSSPSLLIVDSVQTLAHPDVEGAAGGVAQVRAVATALIAEAKERNLPVMLVGHVTKDGTIAGPRTLEHLVDVVCQFEGDRHSRLRLLRAVKNRYGATDEVGCFELHNAGIRGLADPSGLFLSARKNTVPGTCVTVTLEGRRPMPVEIQSLSVPAPGAPRRTTSGVDYSRIAMMLAVIQSRLGIAFEKQDIFVSTVGGARAPEPASDLAVALSLVSSALDLPLAPGVVAIGEVSLTGELRPVIGLQQRLNEAGRLGFRIALIPAGTEKIATPPGMDLRPIDDVAAALEAVLPIPPQQIRARNNSLR